MTSDPGHGDRSALACGGLFVLALCVRILPWRFVFSKDGILPFGNDAFYHLRRIQYGISHFPDVLDFDPFINFPHGAQPIWPPTMDWLVAALLRLVAGRDDPHRVELLAVWLPPIAGAATVVLVYFVASRFYSTRVALLAAGILALLPAHVYYSQIGFVDHHAFVAIVSTWMLGSMMELLRAGDDGSLESREASSRIWRIWRKSAFLGLAMAAAILLWPGTLLFVGVVQAGMVVRLLSAESKQDAIAWSRRFALANFVAMIGVFPLSVGNEWLRWGSYSAVVLSNFQPLYLGAAALSFSVPGLLWKRGWLCDDRRVRALAATACGVILLAALLGSIEELRQAIFDAWTWLAKQEEFQAAVNESAPLFGDSTTILRSRAAGYFSVFIYVVPFAIAGLAWTSRRSVERIFFLWWALALFAATCAQMRFMNSDSIAHSLLLALVIEAVGERVVPRLRDRPTARWTARVLALALVLYALFPIWLSYRVYLVDMQRALVGKPPIVDDNLRRRILTVAAARWLEQNSAPLADGSYSVLGPWGDGHILEYVAERPVVQDNFGDDVAVEGFALAEEYFAADDEAAALRILEQTGTRYVLVRATGSGHARGQYSDESMFIRLFEKRGAELGAARAKDVGIPALERHRLIYESARAHGPAGPGQPLCRLYEIVEGARLEGRANPGARVRIQLGLRSRLGGRFRYSASTRADADGRYAITLPYPNEAFSVDVTADDHYTLRSGDAFGLVTLSEDAVRTGRRIEGPALQSGGGR